MRCESLQLMRCVSQSATEDLAEMEISIHKYAFISLEITCNVYVPKREFVSVIGTQKTRRRHQDHPTDAEEDYEFKLQC